MKRGEMKRRNDGGSDKGGAKAAGRDPKAGAPAEGETARWSPLPPSRKSFVALFLLFLVWLGVLLTMYFATVYPRRYGDQPSAGAGPATRPGASGLPSAPR